MTRILVVGAALGLALVPRVVAAQGPVLPPEAGEGLGRVAADVNERAALGPGITVETVRIDRDHARITLDTPRGALSVRLLPAGACAPPGDVCARHFAVRAPRGAPPSVARGLAEALDRGFDDDPWTAPAAAVRITADTRVEVSFGTMLGLLLATLALLAGLAFPTLRDPR